MVPSSGDTEAATESVIYKRFKDSRYIFFFGGRLRTVKNTNNYHIFTLTVIILCLVLHLIFEASWLWHNVSPLVVIMFLYCWSTLFINFIKAAGMDPGILPRNVHINDDAAFLPQEYLSDIKLPAMNKFGEVTVKYCSTCRIWRLPRSSHCSTCNSCIMYHDHHCMWINNCVGLRNYSYFMNFLHFSCITLIYLVVTSFVHLFAYDSPSVRQALKHIPMTLFLVIFGFLTLFYPLLLLVFQYFLTANLITTREYLHLINTGVVTTRNLCSSVWQNNRFNTGHWSRNCGLQFFKPRGWSNVPVRDRISGNDIRLDYVNPQQHF